MVEVDTDGDGVPDDSTPRLRENLSDPEQNWGEPPRRDRKVFVNAVVPLGRSVEAYGFANWRDYDANGSFFYRRPGVHQLLPVRLADGSIYDPRDRFSGGFTPRFYGQVGDRGLTGGIRGTARNDWNWDLSVRGGENEIEYRLENTLNPSLGPASPKVFHPGDLVTDERAVNADFSHAVNTPLVRTLNVAFGFEYRKEGYELRDRIVLSSDFLIGPEEVVTLQALGVQGANSIAQVSFFNNDLDTESRGIDVVATYSIDSAVGVTEFSTSWAGPTGTVSIGTPIVRTSAILPTSSRSRARFSSTCKHRGASMTRTA